MASTYREQESAIRRDEEDLQALKEQIDKVKKLKEESNSNKTAVKELKALVQTIKLESSQLKVENKQELKQNFKTFDGDEAKNINTMNLPGRITNINKFTTKTTNRKLNASASQQSFNLMGHSSNYRTDYNRVEYNKTFNAGHTDTKRNVIQGFVQELTLQLERNETNLKREQLLHEQTLKSYELCLGELAELRKIKEKFQYYSAEVCRQNDILRIRVEEQTARRLSLQDELRQKSALLLKYESIFMKSCSSYEEELSKMDRIYHSIESELGY